MTTGLPVNYRFGFPATNGEIVGQGYLAKVLFDKSLGNGITDPEFLAEFLVLIDGITAPSASLAIVRNENPADDALAITLPNLYTGDASTPHEIRVIHQRGDSTLTTTRKVLAVPTKLPDRDNDGLPDIWELTHGLEPSNPNGVHGATGDFDHDGISNILEFLAKKNPLTSSSPVFTATVATGNNTLLRFEAYTDRRYRIWRGADLNNLVPDASYLTVAEDDLDYSLLESQNGPRQFYALEISLAQ